MKKAFNWLTVNGINYHFVDYKTHAPSAEKLAEWIAKIGLDVVVNFKSTTYKQLSAKEQKLLSKPNTATAVIQSNTSVIKRPLVEYNNKIITGFNEKIWCEHFKQIIIKN